MSFVAAVVEDTKLPLEYFALEIRMIQKEARDTPRKRFWYLLSNVLGSSLWILKAVVLGVVVIGVYACC